jgi:hypothetical protein
MKPNFYHYFNRDFILLGLDNANIKIDKKSLIISGGKIYVLLRIIIRLIVVDIVLLHEVSQNSKE